MYKTFCSDLTTDHTSLSCAATSVDPTPTPQPGRVGQKRPQIVCVCTFSAGDLVLSAVLSGYFDIIFGDDQDILSTTLAGFGSRIADTLKLLSVLNSIGMISGGI